MPRAKSFSPALFLDRDGIINEDRGYVYRRGDFNWLDGIFDLVRMARMAGFLPVIVTNQSGIGRSLYNESDFAQLTEWMCARFEAEGAPIERVYHCPYHPEATRREYRASHPWRKPEPGMILQARDDLGLDLARSILIGDQWRDITAGVAAGVGNIVLVGEPDRKRANETAVSPPAILTRLPDVRAATAWFADFLAAKTGRPMP